MEFKDSGVIITGGASGIGLAAAHAFAAQGARVVINDLLDDHAKTAAATLDGSGHLGLSADVTCESDMQRLVERAIEHCGRVKVLINCAGIPDTFKPTVEQDVADFRRLLDIHLTGTYLTCKTLAPHLLEQGGGAIINISSIGGVLGLAKRNAYSAAKAGIGMLTRTLGCEWAAQGIRVNAIAPGYMMTPFFQRLLDEGKLDAEQILRRTPAGCFGTAQHIADAMLFLASDRAAFITGVTLPVDGGYMAYGAPGDAS